MTMRSVYGPHIELPPMLLKGSTSYGNIPVTMDAASEQVHMVGELILPDGPGTSKSFSNGGGKIHWRSGSTTWAVGQVGSTVRIGVQDVSTSTSPAQGDGTFDIYADLVQGVDAITANMPQSTVMTTNTSGAKTLTHGQLIAVCWNMSVNVGSAIVQVQTNNPAYGSAAYQSPVVMLGTPTFVRQSTAPTFILEFDDGTIGWFYTSSACLGGGSTVAFNVSTGTFDEYGNTFIPASPIRISGIAANINIGSAATDYELCLYSDPLNLSVAGIQFIDKIVVDSTQMGLAAGTGIVAKPFGTNYVLKPDTTYGISVRPTTANNITLSYQDVIATSHWMSMGGTADRCYAIKRLNNTGAFSDFNGGVAMTRRFNLAVLVDQFSDNAGRATSLLGI